MIVYDKKLVYIIACHAAGKKTYIRTLEDYVCFERVEIIELLNGSKRKFYHQLHTISRVMFYAGIERALQMGVRVAVASTAHSPKRRQKILDMARQYGYETEIRILRTSPEVCIERAKNDPRRPKTTNWTPMIRTWYRNFVEPLDGEADSIVEVDWNAPLS
jgi:predicted kinase